MYQQSKQEIKNLLIYYGPREVIDEIAKQLLEHAVENEGWHDIDAEDLKTFANNLKEDMY